MRNGAFTLVAGSVAALVLAVSMAAASRVVTIGSRLRIKSSALTFSGTVSSSKAACRQGRKVTLYRAPSLVLGSSRTSAPGHWRVTVSGSAGITLGHFYARVSKRSEGTAGTIYVCAPARSNTVPYKP